MFQRRWLALGAAILLNFSSSVFAEDLPVGVVPAFSDVTAGLDSAHPNCGYGELSPTDIQVFEKYIGNYPGCQEDYHNPHCPNYHRLLLSAYAEQKTTTPPKPFSDDEFLAVSLYSYQFFSRVNPALRKHDPSVRPFVMVLNSALHKLPDYQGEVTRYDHMSSVELADWKPNHVVTYPSYMSTMGKGGRIVADAPYAKYRQILHITSKHGKLIEAYSGYPEEHEVLFAPDTKFQVKSRVVRPDGKVEITAEEL